MESDNRVHIRLGDVCTKIGSGATPQGGSSVYLEDGDIALIRSQNVYNEGFRHEGLVHISQEHAEQLSNVEVQPNDILLNITGDSVARCCQVDPSILPARVNQHVSIIRADFKHLDARFLRYLMISPQMQTMMLSWAGAGGTRNALTKGMIESFEISVPKDLVEQQAIACILGALDDKIELNRRMNQTLEEMAQALFKSWFVDFDPVRAKAAGQQLPGLAPHIAELFPDRFVESALGEIPEGWEIRGLSEIGTFLNGLALQRYPPSDEQSLPVIKIAQLRKGNTEDADQASVDIDPAYIVDDGDVVFSWSGSLECVLWTGGRGALNQHLFKVTSDVYPKWFYYLWIQHHLPWFRSIAAGKATTMGHIQRHHLAEAKVVVPRMPTLLAMDRIVSPLVTAVIFHNIESCTLVALRNILLPKLISGELRVPDAEQIVGRCV